MPLRVKSPPRRWPSPPSRQNWLKPRSVHLKLRWVGRAPAACFARLPPGSAPRRSTLRTFSAVCHFSPGLGEIPELACSASVREASCGLVVQGHRRPAKEGSPPMATASPPSRASPSRKTMPRSAPAFSSLPVHPPHLSGPKEEIFPSSKTMPPTENSHQVTLCFSLC